MNTVINRIKENTFLSILTALVLGITVLYLSKYFSSLTSSFIENNLDVAFSFKSYINGLFTILLSLISIWFVNNKSFTNYGFVKPKNINYLKMSLISVGITTAAMIVGSILFMGILARYFPTTTNNFPELTLVQQLSIRLADRLKLNDMLTNRVQTNFP